MNYHKEYLGVIPGYDVDSEGFSSIPPHFSGDLNIAVHPPRHLAHGKRTAGRTSGPRIRSISTGGRPPGPHTHKKNVPKRPPALHNDGNDDSDINVCPPPSIIGHGNITISPPGPPTHGFNTPVRPPRMPIYTPLYTPPSFNHDSNRALRPPGYGIQKSRMPIYTPLYTSPSFGHNSNAVDNGNDDDSDVNVCPPPFIDDNGTLIIGPPCPVTLETNIAVHLPGLSAHRKKTVVRSPTSSN